VTTPPVICAVAVAVEPNPTGLEMTTFGTESYPAPPPTTEIELTVPPVETTDVAVAPSFTT